jgi:hypothetical protein
MVENSHNPLQGIVMNTGAIWNVRGLARERRCYAEGGGDCYAKL